MTETAPLHALTPQLDLVAALHKLGVRIRVPDALVEVSSAA